MDDLLKTHEELHAALDGARHVHQVSSHLSGLMGELIDHRQALYKRENDNRLKRQFLRRLPGQLSLAIDALSQTEDRIERLQDCYDRLLDSPDMELEHKLRIGEKARSHVTRLRDVHQRQKDTLQQISRLFLTLSKQHLAEMKGK